LNGFLARWNTLTTIQQIIIGGIGALLLYTLFTGLLGGAGGFFSADQLIAKALILLLALPVHELAHAAVAVALGDPTPKVQGRLTLNPLRHLEIFGAVLILIAGFGWAKPVQWNPRNIRVDPKLGAVLIAVAGPLSNLLMAALSVAILGSFGESLPPLVGSSMVTFAYINVLLAVFNLIPVPPLDGSHVLFALLPGDTWRLRAQLSQFGMLIIFGAVFLFPQIIRVPTAYVLNMLAAIFL
jgi:Zn-dependent protease